MAVCSKFVRALHTCVKFPVVNALFTAYWFLCWTNKRASPVTRQIAATLSSTATMHVCVCVCVYTCIWMCALSIYVCKGNTHCVSHALYIDPYQMNGWSTKCLPNMSYSTYDKKCAVNYWTIYTHTNMHIDIHYLCVYVCVCLYCLCLHVMLSIFHTR